MANMEITAIPARAAAAYPAMEPTPGLLSAAAEVEGSSVELVD